MSKPELSPCPFCGNAPYVESCDRLITIGCKPCAYSRGFRGILRIQESPVKVSAREYYHQHADEQAAEGWNRRAPAPSAGAPNPPSPRAGDSLEGERE